MKTQLLIATVSTIFIFSAAGFGQNEERPQTNPKTKNPIVKRQNKQITQKTVLSERTDATVSVNKLVRKTASVEKTNVSNPTKINTPAITKNYSISSNILITKDAQGLLEKLADRYFERTGNKLHITSGFRPPARQASAMHSLLIRYGAGYVLALYKNPAVSQVVEAFQQNRNNGKAVQAMTEVIEKQVRNKIFLSDHQIERAFDVRLTANAAILRQIVQELGGKFLRETDHYHIEF